MPMDPYEPPGYLPGDPGDRYTYLDTQEEHLEDMQTERKKFGPKGPITRKMVQTSVCTPPPPPTTKMNTTTKKST